MPAASSWGEEGYLARLAERHQPMDLSALCAIAQARMTELVERFSRRRRRRGSAPSNRPAANCFWPSPATGRSSFAPAPARNTPRTRVKEHLQRFLTLYTQLTAKKIDEPWLEQIEQTDNIFPNIDCRYWRSVKS